MYKKNFNFKKIQLYDSFLGLFYFVVEYKYYNTSPVEKQLDFFLPVFSMFSRACVYYSSRLFPVSYFYKYQDKKKGDKSPLKSQAIFEKKPSLGLFRFHPELYQKIPLIFF